MPRREYFLLEGMKASEVAVHFLADADPAVAAETARRKDAYYAEHARGRLYPAAVGCAARLERAGKALALVTGASRTRIEASSILAELPRFAAIITANDVARGKPHPEPYLKALQSLDLPASSCLVVENAPLGIRAAKAAGIRCVALATTLPREDLSEADAVLGGLEELLPWMES
jgi:beta-phosphoglucomutase